MKNQKTIVEALESMAKSDNYQNKVAEMQELIVFFGLQENDSIEVVTNMSDTDLEDLYYQFRNYKYGTSELLTGTAGKVNFKFERSKTVLSFNRFKTTLYQNK